ncbi:hypothetical protein ATX84_10610, partial [Oenococcus oeni]
HYRLGPQRAVCLHCQQESRVQLRRHDLPDCDQRRRQLLHLARRVTAGEHGDLNRPAADKPVFKRFNQFQVDDKLPILAADIGPEPLDFEQLEPV